MAMIVDKRFWMPPAAYFAIGGYVLGIPIGAFQIHFMPGSRDNVDGSSLFTTPIITLIFGLAIGHFLGKKFSHKIKPIRPWIYCSIIGVLLELSSIYIFIFLEYLRNGSRIAGGFYQWIKLFEAILYPGTFPSFYGVALFLGLAVAFVLERLSKKV